jgi:hypothetical protein
MKDNVKKRKRRRRRRNNNNNNSKPIIKLLLMRRSIFVLFQFISNPVRAEMFFLSTAY